MATTKQTFTFPGTELVQRTKDLVHEGNITRIRLKRKDKTLIDVSLTVGASLAAAGMLAAIGAATVLANDSLVEIERETPAKSEAEQPQDSKASTYHDEMRRHIEHTVKSEMRYWAGASDSDTWEAIGHKLASRIWDRVQEERKNTKTETQP